MPEPRNLATHPVHLGLGAAVLEQPEFTGPAWYDDYVARTGADGDEGRLVGLHRFTGDWESWERHPAGAELVVCTEGAMTVIQERADGSTSETALGPGDYAINPAGVWHTANVAKEASALFITAGRGTEHRPR